MRTAISTIIFRLYAYYCVIYSDAPAHNEGSYCPDTSITYDLNTDTAGKPLVCADRGDTNCNMWAVNGFIKTDAAISDILKENKIECISCHDPHYRNQTNPEIDITYGVGTSIAPDHSTDFVANDVDGLFLRRVGGNSDSGVCRTCHAK